MSITPTEQRIAYLCAFEVAPMVAYLLAGCQHEATRRTYLQWVWNRVGAAQQHLSSDDDDNDADLYCQMSVIGYHAGAACLDRDRERNNLEAALPLLEAILVKGGGQ